MSNRREFFKSLTASILVVAFPKAAVVAPRPIAMPSRLEFVAFDRSFDDPFVLGDIESMVGVEIYPKEVNRGLAVADAELWKVLTRLKDEKIIQHAIRETHDFGSHRAFGCFRNQPVQQSS